MTEKEHAPNETASDASRTDEPAQVMPDVVPAGSPTAALDRTRYRRLHTIAGAVLLGTFLVGHLFTHASALGGERSYDRVVGALARSPLGSVVEVVFVLIPFAFHVGYGIHLLARERAGDVGAQAFGSRRSWLLQRISAGVLLVFVLVHVWHLRLQRLFFGLSADALYTELTARLSSTWAGIPWVALFYLLGVLAASAHAANGLFAATGTWNVASSDRGRQRMRLLTATLGLVLFLVGAATVIGTATGTRLLPGADDDSAAPSAPCGSAVPAPSPPFKLRTPSP